jgi:hypothetical protein
MISRLYIILFASVSPSDIANEVCKLMDLFAPYLLHAPKSCEESLDEVSTLQHPSFAFRDGNSYARHVDLPKKCKNIHEERFRINCFRLI